MTKKCVICKKEIIDKNDIEFIPGDIEEYIDVICKLCYNGIMRKIHENDRC